MWNVVYSPNFIVEQAIKAQNMTIKFRCETYTCRMEFIVQKFIVVQVVLAPITTINICSDSFQ